MYSNNAFERIRKLDSHDVIAFFDQVPQRDRRFIFGVFRPPAGFRPNTDAASDILSQKLASRISGRGAHSGKNTGKDAAVMERMWEGWLRANLGDEEFVGHCLENWRNTLNDNNDSAEDLLESEQLAANTELFTRLIELTNRNLCGREDLEIALTFSPFDDSEDLKKVVSSAKPRSEVLEAQEYRMFPAKIAALSKTIENISSRSLTSERNVSQLSSSLDSVAHDLSTVTSSVTSLNNRLKKLSSERSLVMESLESIQTQCGELHDHFNKLKTKIKKTEATIDEDSNGLRESAKIIEKSVNQLSKRIDATNERLGAIEESVESTLTSFAETQTKLETSDASPGAETKTIEITKPVRTIEFTRASSPEKSKPLSDRSSILKTLESNYQLIGLPAREAAGLAREVFCGLVCSQVIVIRGIFASIVATTTSRTLANGNTFSASVPIGVLDNHSLFDKDPALASQANVSCFLLQNANRSPFEGYGQSLIDRSLVRFLNTDRQGPIGFVLATVDDGAAGLPLYPGFLSAGPIIDTDAFGWRHTKKDRGKLTMGHVEISAWTKIVARLDSKSVVSMDEFDDLVTSLGLGSTSVRRLRWQYSYLTQICDSKEAGSALQSLAFGWLIPQLIAKGRLDADTLREFGDGRLDAEATDGRLREVLTAASSRFQ